MATYTQLTRNEDGSYIRETKNTPETFYLVEYSTIATYFKIVSENLEDACAKITDGTALGVPSENRSDVFIDLATGKEEAYSRMKELKNLRKVNDFSYE